jgi:hypothetical protein
MRGFRASFDAGTWTIRPCAPGADQIFDDQLARYTADGNRRITAMLAGLDLADEAWRLEMEKAAFAVGRTQLGVAEAFIDRCRAGRDRIVTIAAPREAISRWSLMQALAAAGEPVKGLDRARLGARLRFLAAAAVGFATWKLALLRDPGGGDLPVDAQVLFAVHPEETNRTGHVMRLLAAQAPRTPLILLGRPMTRRAGALAVLDANGLKPSGATRPYDWRAALTSFPRFLASLGPGMATAATAPFELPFREQSAQVFRRAMGLAAEAWWTRRGLTPRTVVFGHCGLADTAPLERAMQAGGTRTVHWLHGLTAGHVYVGVSNALVTQCGHDAEWHRALGGYGEARAFPLPRPAFRAAGEGMVVLTNFTHPVHPTFAIHGARDELVLMQVMAQAADRLKLPRAAVVWRPHPVLYSLSSGIQEAVRASLAAHGFRAWPSGERSFDRVAAFGVIVSTPSGAALDVLRLGRLPVIAAPDPIDPDHVLARFPLVGRTAGEIAAAVGVSRSSMAAGLYEGAWSGIAPGAVPAYSDLATAAASAGERVT